MENQCVFCISYENQSKSELRSRFSFKKQCNIKIFILTVDETNVKNRGKHVYITIFSLGAALTIKEKTIINKEMILNIAEIPINNKGMSMDSEEIVIK